MYYTQNSVEELAVIYLDFVLSSSFVKTASYLIVFQCAVFYVHQFLLLCPLFIFPYHIFVVLNEFKEREIGGARSMN
jgi:hypothetical protein